MLGQLDVHEEKLYIVPPPHPQSYIFPKKSVPCGSQNLNVNVRNNKNFRKTTWKTYYDIRVRKSFLHRAQNDKLDNNGIRNLFIKNTLKCEEQSKEIEKFICYEILAPISSYQSIHL